VDKSCLMALERTLALFRDPERLVREHPTYRMLATPPVELEARAGRLVAALAQAAPAGLAETIEGVGYLGSGSLPMHALPSVLVAVAVPGLTADQLAQRLRTDEACIFARIERDRVLLDVRTMTDSQLPLVAAALGRIAR
jgi:L-seryl-tRNA(Ser) seleniumtransferase